jgi:glutathione peroxidase
MIRIQMIGWATFFALGGIAAGCRDEGAVPAAAAPPPADVPAKAETPAGAPILDHKVRFLDGRETSLAEWRGHTLLIVNTASQCGLTPQYEELEILYQRYRGRGLVVMGFPSNDFGGQEPGDARQITEFVQKSFGISFPMFEKQVVKGADKSPLYRTLTEQLPAPFRGEIKWNFEKFLVDPSGRVVARFEPRTTPLDPAVTAAIEKYLPPPAR